MISTEALRLTLIRVVNQKENEIKPNKMLPEKGLKCKLTKEQFFAN